MNEYVAAKTKSLEKAASADAAELLAMHMSDISENHYCAGWLVGLEYKLWDVLKGGDPRFGLGDIPPRDIDRLAALHTRAGGWWIWDESVMGELFVTTAEWLDHLVKRGGGCPDV